jgi:hypothetical protein
MLDTYDVWRKLCDDPDSTVTERETAFYYYAVARNEYLELKPPVKPHWLHEDKDDATH